MMKRPIATIFASLLGLTAVGACAVDGNDGSRAHACGRG
jgi:hypothetical protein